MNYVELISAISDTLRAHPAQIEKIVKTAPFRYKHYEILKRSGSKRSIYHPSPALKSVQRWLVKNVLSDLPVHGAVYSYVENKNIALNAREHIGSNYFIRLDFTDFFPSISGAVIAQFLKDSTESGFIALDKDAIQAVVRLLCRIDPETRRLALTIGAPSSPQVSNTILYGFDEVISKGAAEKDAIYTRYADDVYISSKRMAAIDEMEIFFRRALREKLPFIQINEKKVQHLSRKRRVTITGINISSDRKVSIGRDKKREIKTKVYLALNGRLRLEELQVLRGQIAHAMSVEPSFYESLKEKFGEDAVVEFMRFSKKNA